MSVLDEIEAILSSLSRVKGIIGVIFTDPPGEIISSKMPDNYSRNSQNSFVSTVLELKSNMEELDFYFSELTYNYAETRVVFCDLQHGNLFMVCQSSISIPFLQLSTKIPCKKLTNIMKELR